MNNNGKAEYSEWHYGPQNRFLSALIAEFSNYNFFYDRASVIASYQRLDEDRITRPFTDTNRSIRQEDVSVYALNLDMAKTLDSNKQLPQIPMGNSFETISQTIPAQIRGSMNVE